MDKYEEALERAKELHEAGNALTKSQMEIVFPELKESEDERIGTRLIALVEAFGQGEYKDEMLAYLERQKEQKPVHTAKEMWKEMRLEVYAQASGNRHEPNYSDDSTKMFSLCDIDEIFEKIGNSTVGSQPVEWSEEDEKMLERCISKMANIIPAPGKHGLEDMSFEKHTDEELAIWLKSLPERFNLQSKQESEPMEIKYAGKIYKVYGTKEFPGGVVGYKIKDEPGQFDYIINPDEVLGGGYDIKSNGSFYPAKEANLDPPHWKPSKDQMKALNKVANNGVLLDLFNDLLKLL